MDDYRKILIHIAYAPFVGMCLDGAEFGRQIVGWPAIFEWNKIDRKKVWIEQSSIVQIAQTFNRVGHIVEFVDRCDLDANLSKVFALQGDLASRLIRIKLQRRRITGCGRCIRIRSWSLRWRTGVLAFDHIHVRMQKLKHRVKKQLKQF